ncbi:MAG: hypothetical protein ACK4Z8_09650 [Novosphingobium sp.]
MSPKTPALVLLVLATTTPTPALAGFALLRDAKPKAQVEKEAPGPANPFTAGISAREGARIAAVRSRSTNQYRPVVKCETDVALDEDMAGRANDYSQPGSYVGNLTVVAGGICPAARRNSR